MTASGVQQALELAGHDVEFIPRSEGPLLEADGVDLALIAVDDPSRLDTHPAVAACAELDIPIVWWSDGEHTAELVGLSSVCTVGVLATPVHEAQLLAAVEVGLSVSRSLHEGASGGDSTSDPYEAVLERFPFTARQREIVRMIMAGDRVSTIAEVLDITPSTVRAHLNRVFARLGVRSQAMLVRRLKKEAAGERAAAAT